MGASTLSPSSEGRAYAVPWSDHRVQGESESSLAPANHRVQARRSVGEASLTPSERSLRH